MAQEELTILSIQFDNLMKEKKTLDVEKRQAEKTLGQLRTMMEQKDETIEQMRTEVERLAM